MTPESLCPRASSSLLFPTFSSPGGFNRRSPKKCTSPVDVQVMAEAVLRMGGVGGNGVQVGAGRWLVGLDPGGEAYTPGAT